YLQDAADGLDHLIEKHNLQHLDVKPRNLFLIGDRVKVADFGLVKHLERQSSAGMGGVTPPSAAPETFTGKISTHTAPSSLAQPPPGEPADPGRTQIVGDLKLPNPDAPAPPEPPQLDKHALPVRIRPVSPQVAPNPDAGVAAEPVYPAPPTSDSVLRPTVVI